MYKASKYGIKLSKAQHNFFEVWNKKYPPGEWEKAWTEQVMFIEGYVNPFIK